MFVNEGKRKRGNWLSSRAVLHFDKSISFLTIKDPKSQNMRGAVEDIRHVLPHDSLTRLIKQENDNLNDDINH